MLLRSWLAARLQYNGAAFRLYDLGQCVNPATLSPNRVTITPFEDCKFAK